MLYVLLITVIIALVRYQYVLEVKIFSAMVEKEVITASEENKEEWRLLSWSGENPFRVISLASTMTTTMGDFEAAKHLASSFYSQVKFLVKKGHLPTALAFYSASRKCSDLGLRWHNRAVRPLPIDFEVLGAPDFLASRIPIVGWFGFTTRALEFLWTAEELLKKQSKTNPLEASLIWSKLWALTGDNGYRHKVLSSGLQRDMDENQLKRIAKHLRFKTLQELYKACSI